MSQYPLYDALTPKQQRFVDAYLKDPNATKAAKIAGYKSPSVEGCRLLTNAKIQAALQERGAKQAEVKERDIMAADEVLELLTTYARSKTIEPKDSIKALELLGKRFALFQESTEIEETERGYLILPARRPK